MNFFKTKKSLRSQCNLFAFPAYNGKKKELSLMYYTDSGKTAKSQTFEILKELIEEAIKDEILDSRYYLMLAEAMADTEDRKIIIDLEADEEKHRHLLESIYSAMTGENPPRFDLPEIELPSDLTDALSEKIFDETDSLDFYTRLLSNLTENDLRDILIEIIADESIHTGLLNYLFAKYKSE